MRSSRPADYDPPFWPSWAIQRRVIGALLMREVITRFGRHNLGVLWLVFEPMIFTLGVAALWIAAGMRLDAGVPVLAFAVTGYSSVLLWRNCANCCSGAIPGNLSLLYHRNVKVLDVMLTRIILEIAGATASFFVLSTLFVVGGWMSLPVDFGRVVAGWLMLAWFGASLALVIGAGTAYGPIVEKFWHPASYLLFPMSGAAFMVDWLPPAAQEFALWLPMVHGVEMLREGYFGNTVHTRFDTGYMAIVCLLLTWFGLLLVRGAGQKAQVQ